MSASNPAGPKAMEIAALIADLEREVQDQRQRLKAIESARAAAEALEFEGPPPPPELVDDEHFAWVEAARRKRHDQFAIAVMQASATVIASPGWSRGLSETMAMFVRALADLRACRELAAAASRVTPGNEASPLLAELRDHADHSARRWRDPMLDVEAVLRSQNHLLPTNPSSGSTRDGAAETEDA